MQVTNNDAFKLTPPYILLSIVCLNIMPEKGFFLFLVTYKLLIKFFILLSSEVDNIDFHQQTGQSNKKGPTIK
ncbi:MAG: hypothetical protein K0R78_1057 [Pelosinus sp.]|nr:hypothetical protein [Pelosinus sp.]